MRLGRLLGVLSKSAFCSLSLLAPHDPLSFPSVFPRVDSLRLLLTHRAHMKQLGACVTDRKLRLDKKCSVGYGICTKGEEIMTYAYRRGPLR